MEIYDVVKKLIGPIEPVGETNQDDKRFKNLSQLTDLVDKLVFDINQVAGFSNSEEYSVKRAGNHAKQFIQEIKGA